MRIFLDKKGKGDVPIRAEHGNQPFFSTEFGNILYILANFGNRSTGEHGYVLFFHLSNGYFEIIRTEIGNHTP